MTWTVTTGELEYQAAQVLTGKTFKVFLAMRGSLGLTDTVAAWEAVELAATNGYASITGTVGSGSINTITGRFDAPVITGTWGPGAGAGFTYDAIVIKVQGRTKPYAINLLDQPVTLAAGQSRGFQLTLQTATP